MQLKAAVDEFSVSRQLQRQTASRASRPPSSPCCAPAGCFWLLEQTVSSYKRVVDDRCNCIPSQANSAVSCARSVCNPHRHSNMMASAYSQLSTPALSSIKLEAAMDVKPSQASQLSTQAAQQQQRPYYGKCQYKTGKCFNERTLKRNGEVHSLCEEHRVKQNLIQRRSDRKYQTVHAIRRRERSQRRAVLKKQVSLAVAQQLFYEHQQQKSMGLQPPHPLASLATPSTTQLTPSSMSSTPQPAVNTLAPPIQIPSKLDALGGFANPFLNSSEGLASPILSFTTPSAFSMSRRDEDADDEMEIKEEPTAVSDASSEQSSKPDEHTSPTGIDDFSPDTFLNLCCGGGDDAFASFAPILSARAERELWTEDDIEFLQTLLLA